MNGFQQGDVILVKRDEMPKNAKPVEARGGLYVLAEGEHTGHAHTLEATPEVELREVNGTLWLKVVEASTLTHQEHHTQTIAPGIYEIGRVREVDPFTDEIRTVAD